MPHIDPEQDSQILHVGDLRGGRNGHDPAASLSDDQCVAALNIDWNNGAKIAARRRWGAVPIATANNGATFANNVNSLHRHVPASNETVAELWGIDANQRINRLSQAFLPVLANTFDATIHTSLWTPHVAGFNPSTVLMVNQLVKIDGNTYTINSVNSTAFTTTTPTSAAYSAIGVAPQGAVWSVPLHEDSFVGAAQATGWVSLNNKLVIANQWSTDTFGSMRLSLWDVTANSGVGGVNANASFGATAPTGYIRRAGIAPGLYPPIVANASAGSTQPTRYYRTRWIEERFLPGFGTQVGPASNLLPTTLTVGPYGTFSASIGFGQTGNVVVTVNANLTVQITAAAAGGGGSGSNTGATSASVSFLAVAGGGAAGDGTNGGGAGGGGQVVANTQTIGSGTYAIVIGSGGSVGVQPTNTTFMLGATTVLTANAGQNGSVGSAGPPNTLGTDGAGGSSGAPQPGAVGYGGFPQTGGGGGGSSAAASGVTGGAGVLSSISGSSVGYGGGGGAGATASAVPGNGTSGGGNGSNTGIGTAGTPNSGGGAGGGNGYALGGSGVFIISYTTGALSATGGTITTSGGQTIHTFTSNGSWVVTATGGEGGAGGGGGASNASGFSVTLLSTKSYTLHVGAGGAGAANSTAGTGGDTFLHNDTDSTYVFWFTGGAGASSFTPGVGGVVTTGTGLSGGAGGAPGTTSTAGSPGSAVGAGTGGGGGGGWGGDNVNSNSAIGGNGGGTTGQIAQFLTGPPIPVVGGHGGEGGGVQLLGVSAQCGGGGYGAGGNQVTSGNIGQDGLIFFGFSPQTWNPSLGGANNTIGSNVWVSANSAAFNPQQYLIPGQEVFIDNHNYMLGSVNSTAFTTLTNSPANYTAIAVQPQTSIVYRRSEPSPIQSLAATANAVTITRPSPNPNDFETHWELEASTDQGNFFRLGTYPLAYLTATDVVSTAVGGGYDTTIYALSDTVGTYNVPKPYKFVGGDGNRMLGFGSWNPTDPQNWLEWSAVVGSKNIGDIERIPNTSTITGYRALDESDSGDPTGLYGPIFGVFFAFKTNQVWQIAPTGNDLLPFSANAVSKTIGALPRTIVAAEDESGQPALYWWSKSGPYRAIINPYGEMRADYIGHGIQDRLDGTLSSLQYSSVSDKLGDNLFYHHAVYYTDARQIWWYLLTNTGANGKPQYTKLVFNIGRTGENASDSYKSGWSIHDGPSSQATSSVMFSRVTGAVMSHDLVPYVGPRTNIGEIWQCDVNGVNTDNGSPYQAYVLTKAYTGGLHRQCSVNRTWVVAYSSPSIGNYTPFYETIIGDYGVQVFQAAAVDLTADVAGQQQVRRRFDDSGMADVTTVQFMFGDAPLVVPAPSYAAQIHWVITEFAMELIPRQVA